MARKNYSPEERTAAVLLAEQLGSADSAGRQLGIPGATVRRWRTGKQAPSTSALVREVKGAMLDRLTEGAMLFFDRMLADLRNGKLSPGQAIVAFGVTADKMIAIRRERPDRVNAGQVDAIAAALALDTEDAEARPVN